MATFYDSATGRNYTTGAGGSFTGYVSSAPVSAPASSPSSSGSSNGGGSSSGGGGGGSSTPSPITSSATVNSLYQKYFGRNAQPAELTYWQTQPASGLDTELLKTYKSTSGLSSYDGSPIPAGSNKTTNQNAGKPPINPVTPIPTITDPRQPIPNVDPKTNLPIPATTTQTGGASDTAINNLYQKYFGRTATSGELTFWKTQDISQLESQLKQDYMNSSGIAYDGSIIANGQTSTANQIATKAEAKLEKDNLDKANAYIDASAFDDATKALLKQIAQQQYKWDTKIYQGSEIDKIISDASLAATGALDPYYTKDTARSIEDFKNKISDIRAQADLNTQKEQKTYAKTLQDTKNSLMSSGRTFSSASRDQLGGSSALGSGDVAGAEGSVPLQRRLDVTQSYNTDASKARDLWITAERYLGSNALNGVSTWTIANPYGTGTTYNPNSNTSLYIPAWNVANGDQQLARLKAIEEDKQARIRAMYL